MPVKKISSTNNVPFNNQSQLAQTYSLALAFCRHHPCRKINHKPQFSLDTPFSNLHSLTIQRGHEQCLHTPLPLCSRLCHWTFRFAHRSSAGIRTNEARCRRVCSVTTKRNTCTQLARTPAAGDTNRGGWATNLTNG